MLREWRLEEVLGVGGFGIVYKGRGIYFNELVAIKEYFPSSISERGEDDTVVPIDSDAEEVHALGLKKFVEEAKLLWNLSTPTRHPNIVSVRSLFEIHGTAYMVMDFEDGTSLSRMLKKGQKFNEASLRSMILPIAEGLERAHRVGVLHRDIKPPNIIINDDGRSVLIDFGSARFESGEATSTKVTFHTPPYAAIEQYVRTFPQGPWTDIYALGVVLYECITGTKPAEVLERMHGDAGTLLADGDWPGFSHTFLHAVDKAMAIRPDDRPQTISEWISLLDEDGAAKPDPEVDDDDEDEAATRIGSWNTEAQHIVPVAPTKEGFKPSDRRIETGVPDTPSKAEFSKRSDDSKATKKPAGNAAKGKEAKPADKAPQAPLNRAEESKAAVKEAAAKPVAEAPSKPESTEVEGFVAKPLSPDKSTEQAKPAPKGKDVEGKSPSATKPAAAGSKDKDSQKDKGSKKPIFIGASAVALVAVAGWALSGSDSGSESTSLDSASAV
ncbi:MAG TPA: protein kinase, partial [Erythrobacter sp.]|nr:protein kinase [Erythrobacter sp.]